MSTWAMRQRYGWIDERLAGGEPFNRDDIVQAFTVTKQTASATIAQYRELQPDALAYNGSLKAFVRAGYMPPTIDWKARALSAEAKLDALVKAVTKATHNLDTAARLYDCPGCVQAAKEARDALSVGEGGSSSASSNSSTALHGADPIPETTGKEDR